MAADYSPLLEAIDFGTIASGAIGAGAALVAVYLAIKGVRLIIDFIADRQASNEAFDEWHSDSAAKSGGGAGWVNPEYSLQGAADFVRENNLVWDDEKGDFVERS